MASVLAHSILFNETNYEIYDQQQIKWDGPMELGFN